MIRGFAFCEALSLATWGCAFFVASHYYTYLSVWFTGFEDELVRNGIAIAVLFIATLIVGAIVDLRDRPVGGENGSFRHRSGVAVCFGALRGVLIVAAILFFLLFLHRGVEKRRLEQITADPAIQFYHQMFF
ncbi:CvpA family protein [Escherichia coli]